jgi:anti-sigma factor RsiW/cytoskeletal protein CcmA (bactofilin family)
MTCFPELTYSVYVDGGLSAEEALHVDRHLAHCARCRALVEAMRAEDLTVRQLLQESGAEETSSSESHFALAGVVLAFLGVVAASAGLRAVFERAQSAFEGADWLNPMSPAFYLNLFFSAGTYLFQGGVSMLTSMIETIAVPLLIVSALVFGAWVVLGKRRASSVLLVLMFALGPVSAARALEARKSPHASVAANETVDDSLLASGDTVTIDGVVTGNLIAVGRRITVRGTVKGDVICWGQTIDLDGTVEGNVYCGGQTTNLRGSVSRSVISCGQRILVPAGGRVEGDLLVFGAETGVDGGVGRDVSAFGGVADVRGSVGRNLNAHVGRLNLMAPATVGGDVTAHVKEKKDVQIASGVTISGRSETKVRPTRSPYSRPSFYFWKVVGLLAALITGLFLVWWHPGFFAPGGMDTGKVLQRLGVGFLALVATPIAVAIVGLTLIGLPLALLVLAVWLFGLYAAKILVAGAIGQRLLPAPAGLTGRFAEALFLGLVIVLVAVNLPYVGGLLEPMLILVGLGMAVSQWRALQRRPPATRPSGPVI